jgi:preprotein translocase subunit Sec63
LAVTERRRDLDLFGLPEGASAAEIRRAYRRLVLSWHPDRLRRAAPEIHAQATTYLQELNAAYGRLTPPLARAPGAPNPNARRPQSGRRWKSRSRRSVAPPPASSGSGPGLIVVLIAVLVVVFLGVALTVLAVQGADALDPFCR